jgi:hypothetical protein
MTEAAAQLRKGLGLVSSLLDGAACQRREDFSPCRGWRGQKFCAVTQISGTFFRGYLLDTESF